VAGADYGVIEPEWRAGILTVRQLSALYEERTGGKLSHQAITKYFTKFDIPRDLSAKIKAKADALVAKAAVAKTVAKATESSTVDANAHAQADVILSHRTDVPQQRELVRKLAAEVDALTDNKELVEQMTLALESGDMEKLAGVAQKVASLPMRIKGAVELVGALKSLVELERKVFGIESQPAGNTIEDLLEKLDACD